MGLAASQGRLLLLTARKTDLEFRAQQISQKRINLSRQLEDIATAYETATSNRQMKISVALASDAASANSEIVNKSINLTYAALISGTVNSGFAGAASGLQASDRTGGLNYTSTTAYLLKDAGGATVISSVDDVYLGDPGNPFCKKEDITAGADGYIHIKDHNGTDHKYLLDKTLALGSTDANGNTDGPNYLQDCLRNGKYLIEKGTLVDGEVKWSSLSWDTTTNITDSYYAEDDDKAEVEYNRKQTEIQTQDKKLELELDNIETERSEAKTEKESVEKVIGDNIEDSCNVFA